MRDFLSQLRGLIQTIQTMYAENSILTIGFLAMSIVGPLGLFWLYLKLPNKDIELDIGWDHPGWQRSIQVSRDGYLGVDGYLVSVIVENTSTTRTIDDIRVRIGSIPVGYKWIATQEPLPVNVDHAAFGLNPRTTQPVPILRTSDGIPYSATLAVIPTSQYASAIQRTIYFTVSVSARDAPSVFRWFVFDPSSHPMVRPWSETKLGEGIGLNPPGIPLP